MNYYFDKLDKIKKLGPIDYITFQINDADVSMRPVDDSDETINLLTKWRNDNWYWFDKFIATKESTSIWLKNQVINNPDRILFLIFLNGEKIGHIGTFRYNESENSAEIDNVLRGIRGCCPGLMEYVTNKLISWMFSELKLSKIKLKVFSDNYKAINLYERCKMLTIGNIPLKREFNNQGWKWIPVKSSNGYAERYYSIMEIIP
jgi:RimJ/RimL family protein N-acetyltransferase